MSDRADLVLGDTGGVSVLPISAITFLNSHHYSAYKTKAEHDISRGVLAKASWDLLLIKCGFEEHLNSITFTDEVDPKPSLNPGCVVIKIPESVMGEPVSVKLFEKLGFSVSIQGFNGRAEVLRSLYTKPGTYEIKSYLDAGACGLTEKERKQNIPKEYKLPSPVVELSKNILMHSINPQRPLNQNILCHCHCSSNRLTALVSAVTETLKEEAPYRTSPKRLFVYSGEFGISDKMIGSSFARKIAR